MSEVKTKRCSSVMEGRSITFSKVYLIFYNVLQFLGWMVILIQTISHLCVKGGAIEGLWEETKLCLKIFQTLALIEIIHALLGLVRSGAATTFIQIISRIIVVWPICNHFKSSQETYGLLFILIAWSITEIIRYSFYFLNILKISPSVLIYLRYTLFIVLYPMGVLGEQWCILSSMPEISSRKAFSLTLPNKFNFTFDFYYFCVVFLMLYIPFFPQLYLHMFAQRRKVLFNEPTTTSGKLEKKE